MLEAIQNIDGSLLIKFQHLVIHDALTPVVRVFTHMGNTGAMWIVIALILMLFKKTRKYGLLALVALGLTYLLNNLLIKNLVDRTRPYETFDKVRLLIEKQDDASFPSGHSASSFAVAMSIYLYFPKKYGSNPVHSEVLEAMQTVRPGRALDLGCGQGRNALFLAKQGFEVTAVDQNELALEILRSIVEQEDLDLPVGTYDINSASLTQTYDLIVSTVVLMFLQAERIPDIIRNMQEHTALGGYNLIVCAMDTEDFPCSVPFPFTFKEGELAEYYKDWELVKYNENPGHLHRRDENGNRIQLRFATMLAKKIQ